MSEIRQCVAGQHPKSGQHTSSLVVGYVVVLQLTVGAAELVAEASLTVVLQMTPFALQMIAAVFRAVEVTAQFERLLRGEHLPALVACHLSLLEAILTAAVPVDETVIIPPNAHIRVLARDELLSTRMTSDLRHTILAEFRGLFLSEHGLQRKGVLPLATTADIGQRHEREIDYPLYTT